MSRDEKNIHIVPVYYVYVLWKEYFTYINNPIFYFFILIN